MKNIVLIITIFFCARGNGKAYEYQASGRLDVQHYLAGGKIEELKPVFFHIYVRDCQWLVQATPLRPHGVDYNSEISSDGKYIYNFGELRNNNGSNLWGGAIAPDGVPFFGPIPTIPVIWLALADSCYLDQNPIRMPPPYSAAVLRTPLAIHLVRRQQSPRLPDMIVFMNDGYDRRDGQTNENWPPPFDHGFTNAIYSASGFTNIGGIELPREFNLEVLRPAGSSATGKKLVPEFLYRGYITNMSRINPVSDFVPKPPDGCEGDISDSRFAITSALVPHPFDYRASNWLSEQAVRNLPGFSSYEKSQPFFSNFIPVLVVHGSVASANAATPRARAAVIGMLAMVSLTALILIWITKSKNKTNKEQQKNKEKTPL